MTSFGRGPEDAWRYSHRFRANLWSILPGFRWGLVVAIPLVIYDAGMNRRKVNEMAAYKRAHPEYTSFHGHYEDINKIWDKNVSHEYLKKVVSRESWEKELADDKLQAARAPLPPPQEKKKKHDEHHDDKAEKPHH